MGIERATTTTDGTGDELRARVVALMARLVAGDTDALWELHAVAEPWLRRIVRAEARRVDIRLSADEELEITLDAAIELRHLAASWRPDGALPWVWAHRRIAALVHEEVGTFTRPLEEEHLEREEVVRCARSIDDPRAVLAGLARRHARAADLHRALLAVSERDADIYLRVLLERAAGNRAPAITVGADHDLQPATVRKVVQRVTAKVRSAA